MCGGKCFLENGWTSTASTGACPRPYIEITQGDHVRFVVHNELPEATTVHWHGAELPANMDGVPGITQDFIEPGSTYVYEFPVHQAGTFFYHAHVPLQEANGIVGFLIIHPAVAWDPPVDRDFGLLFQNISIGPNTTVAIPFPEHDSVTPTPGGFNWQFINGRSAPYTTPLVTSWASGSGSGSSISARRIFTRFTCTE